MKQFRTLLALLLVSGIIFCSSIAASCNNAHAERTPTLNHVYKVSEVNPNMYATVGSRFKEIDESVEIMTLRVGFSAGDITQVKDKYYKIIEDLSATHHEYQFDLEPTTINIYKGKQFIGTISCDSTTEIGRLMLEDNR